MAVEIRVPMLGESVLEVTVARWLKREGETVLVGEGLVELETEKVNTEVVAEEAGVLERIIRREGETARPGETLGLIGSGDGAEAGAATSVPLVGDPTGRSSTSGTGIPGPASAPSPPFRASSVAQQLAAELGVNLAEVQGSGPSGRITREDVQAHAQRAAAQPLQPTQAPSPPPNVTPTAAAGAPHPSPEGARPETRRRLSRRRLTIAQRLVEAQRTAAMLTTFNEVDMSAVVGVRGRQRERFRQAHDVDLGYMSFFTKAVVGALQAFPQLNAELQGEELVLKGYYDIGIAIGDPEGLVVPVLRDADKLSFAGIERAIAGFVRKARERALTLEDLRGGTFTITNGGIYGSLLSTPILNPPQVGILGMHKIEQRPVVVEGAVVVRPMMYVALSYDHRVVDGREAVQFLVRVKELVEDPERLLLGE